MRDEVRGLRVLLATGCALHAADGGCGSFGFVYAVDRFSVELMDCLDCRAYATDAEVVLPWNGQYHYLSAVYCTDLADLADALVAVGERKMRALVDASDTQPDRDAGFAAVVTNVNTTTDLCAFVLPGIPR